MYNERALRRVGDAVGAGGRGEIGDTRIMLGRLLVRLDGACRCTPQVAGCDVRWLDRMFVGDDAGCFGCIVGDFHVCGVAREAGSSNMIPLWQLDGVFAWLFHGYEEAFGRQFSYSQAP